MISVDSIRELLVVGRKEDLLAALVAVTPAERRAVCKPLVRQANAIGSAMSGSTVKSWLRQVRDDYPGGLEQFVGAWEGRLTDNHWDAATTVIVASKQAVQAAKVWPIPHDRAFAQALYPALFPDELNVIIEQWSADYATNPKHWDRNAGRYVMYEWIEQRLVAPPQHAGAVLMLLSDFGPADPGRTLLKWLRARPTVTAEVFTRMFTTPGIKGASLAAFDMLPEEPMRTVVVPGLVKAGVWTREFVAGATKEALKADLPAFQRRWFVRLAGDFGV